MSGAEVITLGCRLNIAESEGIAAMLAAENDLIVVNSCAVTNEAMRQSRAAIRRAKRARPDARLLVTGCAAEVDPAMFEKMGEVDGIVPNGEKLNPMSFPRKRESRADKNFQKNESCPPASAGVTRATHARAFVEVQNGCDHRCTFCIIPYGRGNSRSVPVDEAVERVKCAVEAGHNEVVLTGVDVTSYGHDLPGTPTLGQLVEVILIRVPALSRLRLSSLDSVEIDDRLFELITGESRAMPHLHLSLQAGDDMILKRMKRRHNRVQAIALVERLKAKRPEIAIGADIIAGFPTESEAMFDNSLTLVRDCQIVHGHIFPFSSRDGTPAARMPQLDRATIKDRAQRLRHACADERARWLATRIGTTQRALIELDGLTGHDEGFAPVRLEKPVAPGSVHAVRIKSLDSGTLIGEALPS